MIHRSNALHKLPWILSQGHYKRSDYSVPWNPNRGATKPWSEMEIVEENQNEIAEFKCWLQHRCVSWYQVDQKEDLFWVGGRVRDQRIESRTQVKSLVFRHVGPTSTLTQFSESQNISCIIMDFSDMLLSWFISSLTQTAFDILLIII